MQISMKEYRDRVRGCWLGKNIGGSLGAPFECIRGVFDLDFYTADLSGGALPNDDLDLQLVWLNAAERYGKSVDSEILGEYWLSYIVADWSEYGAGKSNMAMGLMPPVSGWYGNHNRNSCGCFIRSELWACLAPGHPEIAVRYAYEDGICDHAGEGLYAEIFCAAVESAAFAEADDRKLIEIGLSYIPEDCAITTAVKTAAACYDGGMDWKQARKEVLNKVPGSFGMYCGYEDRTPEPDVAVGELGYDAPSNIGLMLLGWLYGEGDFGKSICIAAGCCEDGDCTAATLGSILGIKLGASALPSKWLDPIGDEIKTISVDLTNSIIEIPKTITALSDRVCCLMPVFLGTHCDVTGEPVTISMHEGEALFDQPVSKGVFRSVTFRDRLKRQPFGVTKKNVLMRVTLDYMDGISIRVGQEKKLRLQFENLIKKQQWVTVTWHISEELQISPCRERVVQLDQKHGGCALTETSFTLTPLEINRGIYEGGLEIRSNGRLSSLWIPVTLIVE